VLSVYHQERSMLLLNQGNRSISKSVTCVRVRRIDYPGKRLRICANSDRRYRMVLPTMRSRFAYKTLSLCDRLQPFTIRPRKLCEDLWVACLFR
jgi:hypothetical protein